MALPKSLTTVTTFSKTLAMILFILLPFVGFYLGIQYQKMTTPQTPAVIRSAVAPTPTCNHLGTVCAPDSHPNRGVCAPKVVCFDPSPATGQGVSPPLQPIKACPQIAYKNPQGQICTYSGPSCDLVCK